MMDKEFKFPFYAKITLILFGIFLFFAILYIGQEIIAPLAFAIIISIVLHPVVKFFVRRKINRLVAIIITLFLTIIVIAAFCVLLFSQASRFSESWPVLVDKFTKALNQSIIWTSGYLDISPVKITEWLAKAKGELVNIDSSVIGKTLVAFGSWFFVAFLIPVYIFLILFYQPILLAFIHRLFDKGKQSQVGEIITKIKNVIQHYLVGLVIEFFIVSTLDAVALLILGIDYAILIGVIGGLLNVIPYIGGVVAVAIPMMIALATKSTVWYALYVLAAYYFIQLIDNNIIVPKIVASKVKINALFSIIVVLVGGTLWGITGMFLSIPLLAIVKLIFDHIEPLKPWGFLLGDTMPSLLKTNLSKKTKMKST
jgi:predicted PurR-regulated permease PerM